MDAEIKRLSMRIVKGISRTVKRMQSENVNLGKRVGIGADGTPTQYIDKVAENIALRYIKESKLSINLLSEEAGFIDFGGEYTLILDPIDGTRNAVRGIPFYGVSLAVGKNTLNSVEYAIVLNIPTQDIYLAEKGGGAYLNNQPICAPQHLSGEILSSIILRKGMKSLTYVTRSLGAASLEMCLVAHGAIDCFACLRDHLRIADIAAATLIVREAHGMVCNREGKELDMPCDIMECTSVVAAINKEALSRFLANL
jgi:fructose-1,6-bisphosphatase/inositol monophosphatase family enzyme